MGAQCGGAQRASCQVDCAAGNSNAGCARICGATSSAAPTRLRDVSKEEDTQSRSAFDKIVDQEPVVKATRSSNASSESNGGVAQPAGMQDSPRESHSPKNSPKGSDVGSSPSNSSSKKESREEKLKGALEVVKEAAQGSVAELKTFRKFLKDKYANPGEAFDDFLGFATQLSKRGFFERLEELNYIGNSERLFLALSYTEGDEFIDREVFKHRLVAVGRMPQPKKKEISFGNVVLHAVKQLKKKDIKEMGSTELLEDGWDPPPPIEFSACTDTSDLAWTSPNSKTSFPLGTWAHPIPEEDEAASGQPSASGQPPRRGSGNNNPSGLTQDRPSSEAGGSSSPSSKANKAKGPKTSKPPLSPEAPRKNAKKDTGAGIKSFINQPTLEHSKDAEGEADDAGVFDSLAYSTVRADEELQDPLSPSSAFSTGTA